VDRRWLASGLIGTSRLFKTPGWQTVDEHLLIWCYPFAQSPVDRRWLASGLFGTSHLFKTTVGQMVFGLWRIRCHPCVQNTVNDDQNVIVTFN
jgi:hypothetical protein